MELEGRSVAIVGFGASGQELARRARAFGMRVLAIDVREIEQDVLDEVSEMLTDYSLIKKPAENVNPVLHQKH